MSDVEMAETRPSSNNSMAAVTSADAAEMKKALLVYKSNQQSASDDDDDDDDDDDEEDEDLDDVVSIKSDAAVADVDMAPDEEDDDDDEDLDADDDDDDDDGGVRVEKDDDESINAPSDDDLDSTATPLRATDTDDETSFNKATTAVTTTRVAKHEDGGDSDSTSALSPIKTELDGKTGGGGALKSGSDANAIIAARRRTGARKECEVCGEPRNGRRAMLCTSCKCMYHSSCYRQRFSKLISASGKQWFCPDCETTVKAEAEAAAAAEREALTPRKKREDAGKSRGVRGTKAAPVGKGKETTGGDANQATTSATGAVNGGSTSALELELKRITEIALRGGKKINNVVLERTEEMLQVTQRLTSEIDNVMGSSWRDNTEKLLQNGGAVKDERQPPPFTMPSSSSAQEPLSPVSHSPTNDFKLHGTTVNNNSSNLDSTEKNVLLTRVHAGLASLKNLLQQLQVTGIQFEVDLIKEIKLPPPKDEHKVGASASTAARKTPTSAAAAAAAARASAISKGKNGASRLYSSKQIQKLEDWYQKSSRPESCEIQAMYRIINSPEYADKELQPEGISVKQIRIWFDNRRAKERLDYMRLKMKDISTTDMDVESVKRMKAAYIDEAKEVLEARVSRLRENGKGPSEIVDEAGDLLLSGGDRSLPTSKGGKASPSSKADGAPDSAVKLVLNPKKRIRIDHVASVRRAVKDARDSGKSEEEIKAVRASAIERARERTHIPYKNARQGPTKPLGKDEVTHIKLKMLKQLEEDASAEELTDLIELLLSVIIPRDILIESALHRQLNLVLKAHKDNKELVKQTNKLLDEYNMIVEKGDSIFAGIVATGEEAAKKKLKKKEPSLLLDVEAEASLPASSPGASPDSPAASPDSRRPRVKFSLEQLVKLEKYFHKDDTPSKKKLDKLADKLNDIGARDPASDDAQKSIDYKQIRCWFYKRRSTNQRPQALTSMDIQEVDSSSGLSESDSGSDNDGSVSSKSPSATKSKSSGKRKAPSSSATGETKAVKRSKKDPAASNTTTASITMTASSSASASGEAKAARPFASSSSASKKEAKVKDASGKHPGRIFNVKQLATIIEEYEKNPRPSISRLEELQNILNQDDHADDNFVNPTGVTKRQVKTWFSNRRAKERLDLIKMKVQDGGEVDMADSETEDEERGGDTKLTVKKTMAGIAGDDARKELFASESAARQLDADMESDDLEDDDLSDAESEKSALAVAMTTAVQSSEGSKMPSMRMLVDDDDSDDDDDDDLDSDDDA